MERLMTYFRDTRAELAHVSWPTPRAAAVYTALIVGISLLTATLLGLFDALFSYGLDWALGV